MAASKTLILLKGIGGIAATSLATLGGMEVGYKFQSTKTVGTAHSDDSSRDIEEMPEEYIEEVSDLGIPSGCDEKCDLTAEQLRGLKFEQRSDSSILFDGLKGSDTFELTISEVSEDTENYPWGKKYTLKAKTTTAETITIKGLKGDDIVLGKEEGVDLRETSERGWLEKVPEEVNELGIPKRCEVEQDEESAQTCELTREQLQRLKFETRDDETSISIVGLKDKNTVTLTVEKVTGDEENYPQGKKYTLKSKTGTVTIKGVKERDIVLEENKGVDFREKQGDKKLETVEDSLGIPRRCTPEKSSCQLTKEELQRLKFETETGSSIEVDLENDDDKVELKVETTSDLTNYPKGKKYTIKATEDKVTIKGVKGGDIDLEVDEEDNQEGVVIREKESGGLLEKAPEEVDELGIPKSCNADKAIGDTEQTCELTADQLKRFKFESKGNGEITVEGLTAGNKVTLEIEGKDNDKTNYPRGKKYTLTSSKDKVTIRNVKEGDIEIEASGMVAIRETGRGGKLEEVPEEVDGLGIPTGCTTREPCQLKKDQLQRLKFETRSSSSITIDGLEENNTVELKVEEISKDRTNYPKGKKYTLTSKAGKVTIKGLKEGDIVLESNLGVVIREQRNGGKLERGPEEVDDLGIPKNCNVGSCQLTKEQLKKISFEAKKGSSVWISGMGVRDTVTLKVEEPNDSTNYPKGKKYSFTARKDAVTIKNTKDWDIDLEKDKEVLIREKQGGGKLETVEDALGIPKSCNANDIHKRPDIQTCQLTADQLKHLKLKAFGGKNANASVSGLSGADKITLKILWEEEDSKYSGNKRYSLDNTGRDEDIKIIKDGREVTLEKKKESWFKNNEGQLELVEAKTRSQVKMKEANEILKKLGLEGLKLSDGDFKDNKNPIKHQQKKVDFSRDDGLKKIQFKVFNGGAEKVEGLSGQKITVYFDWEEDANKFPKNMKFTLENINVSQSIDLMKGKNSIQIWKKSDTKPKNPNNIKNRFKVENDQLVNVPQGS